MTMADWEPVAGGYGEWEINYVDKTIMGSTRVVMLLS